MFDAGPHNTLAAWGSAHVNCSRYFISQRSRAYEFQTECRNIVVDWGTSNFRAYLVAENGNCLAALKRLKA